MLRQDLRRSELSVRQTERAVSMVKEDIDAKTAERDP